MNLTTLEGPAFEPVTLAEVYQHLHLDPDGSPAEHPDDAILVTHIATARAEVERITHRSLVRQKLRLSTDGFHRLFLLRPPLIEVTSVAYYDCGHVLQQLATHLWYVTDDLLPQIVLKPAASPVLSGRRDSVRVEYWAGYPADGSPAGTERADLIANVPIGAKAAVLIGVQLLYDELSPEKREKLELARDALLSGLKILSVA